MGTVSAYLRHNVLGLVAIFLAMTGGAYAVSNKTVFNQDLANSSVDSRVLASGAVAGPDIQAAAVGPKKMKLDKLVKYLQTRVNGACPDGQLVQSIGSDGSVICAPAGAGTITGVSGTDGLTGGGAEGDVELGIDPTVVQSRVTDSCAGNEAVQSIGQNGGTGCAPFVTGVTAGAGLSGGTITDSGTITVDPTAVQSRVSGSCGANEAAQSIAQDGTLGCSAIAATPSGAAGGDLTGTYPNPTLGAGSIDSTSLFSAGLQDGAAGTATLRSLGTGADQAAAGNDARLSDARTPTGAAGGDLSGTYPNPSLGSGVVDATNMAALPGAKIVQTSCQTVPTANQSFTPTEFDGALYEGQGVTFDASLNGGAGGVRVSAAGTYLITAYVEWANSGAGIRAVTFDTGTDHGAGYDSRPAAGGATQGQTATQIVHLPVNATVTGTIAQTSGGDLSLADAGAGCANLAVQWLGP